MKILIPLLLSKAQIVILTIPLFLLSCVVNKYHVTIIKETIVIPEQHLHYPEESRCLYIQRMEFYSVDTIRFEYENFVRHDVFRLSLMK